MFRSFFYRLPSNILACFRGYNLLWQIFAVALTVIAVISGFDWFYFEHSRSALLFSLSLPAAIVGFFLPVISPLVLYYVGEQRKNKRLMHAGSAVAQAELVAYFLSSLYKSLTGRMQPEFLTHLNSVDNSRDFNFGFWQHGIFWGWPSSHAAVAFAGSLALFMLYPRNIVLRICVILYALYIGLGVSVSIHWFSDAVAGAILGSVVGIVVGKSFLKQKTQ